MRAAYQGAPGAYSAEALYEYFKGAAEPVAKEEFEGVFAAVKSGECDFGVVPVENSISGAVIKNLDLLGRYGLYVCGEQAVSVRHALMGVRGTSEETIKSVYSHEQGFLQCSEYLGRHKEWLKIPYFNTAVSARLVAEKGDISLAAVASPYAMKIYGLSPVKTDIADSENNSTRFLIITADKQRAQNGNKASLYFSLPHEKGALAGALCILSALNLTRIESRPSREKNWEYRFYIDVEGSEKGFNAAFSRLESYCAELRVLGIYSRND